MTDWGLKGIYEVNMEELSVKEFIIGIGKPTGVTQASLRYDKLSEWKQISSAFSFSVIFLGGAHIISRAVVSSVVRASV